jgi:hypothetical protein
MTNSFEAMLFSSIKDLQNMAKTLKLKVSNKQSKMLIRNKNSFLIPRYNRNYHLQQFLFFKTAFVVVAAIQFQLCWIPRDIFSEFFLFLFLDKNLTIYLA